MTTQFAERPESKKDVVEQEPQPPARWKRVCIDAVLFVVVLVCMAELAIRLLHR